MYEVSSQNVISGNWKTCPTFQSKITKKQSKLLVTNYRKTIEPFIHKNDIKTIQPFSHKLQKNNPTIQSQTTERQSNHSVTNYRKTCPTFQSQTTERQSNHSVTNYRKTNQPVMCKHLFLICATIDTLQEKVKRA